MYWSKDTELVFNVAREAKIVAHPWLTSLQVVILLEKSLIPGIVTWKKSIIFPVKN